MSGNELVINVFLYGFLAAILWFVYVVFIKQKLLKAKGPAGKLAYIIKKDASSQCAGCTFYAFHDYENGYSQREWMEFCKQRTNNGTIDEKSEGYAEAVAPIINAIVVDAAQMYMRRGLEILAHSGTFFLPGKNDELSLNYFVEPYKYVKNAKSANAVSETRPKARQTGEEEAKHTAFLRCRNCVNESKCDIRVRNQTGPCGGYTPKEKKKIW